MQVCRNVTGYEVGCIHQISGADTVISKTEMGTGKSSRFLGVVSKIGLHILIGIIPDNLDGVFVGSNRFRLIPGRKTWLRRLFHPSRPPQLSATI